MLMLILIAGTSLRSWSQKPDTIVPTEQNTKQILQKIDVRKMAQNQFNHWQDKFTGHWSGMDFGFNGFLNSEYTGYNSHFMDNDLLRSNSTYLNLIQQSVGLQQNRNTTGLVTGIGIHFQSYRLDNNTTLRQTEKGVIEPEILYFDQNQKSKLSIVSVIVPLLAEFQIPVNHYDNRLYFSAGLFGGIRITSHTKIKYRIDRKKMKLKVPGQYALRDFKYGAMVRAGYRWINVFASCDLTSFFKENKGPELIPFSFGFTLIKF